MSVAPVNSRKMIREHICDEQVVTEAELAHFVADNDLYFGPGVSLLDIYNLYASWEGSHLLFRSPGGEREFSIPDSLESQRIGVRAERLVLPLIAWSAGAELLEVMGWRQSLMLHRLVYGAAHLAGDEERTAPKAEVQLIYHFEEKPSCVLEYRVILANFARTGWNPIKLICLVEHISSTYHLRHYGGIDTDGLALINRTKMHIVDQPMWFFPYVAIPAGK